MNEEMDLHDLQGPNDTPAEDRTTEPPTNVAGGPLLEPHDGGCRCWPHVAQSDALRAVEHAALMEYRSPRGAEAAQGKGERAAQSHNSGHRHVWRCDYCEAMPEGAQVAAPLAVDALANIIRQEDGDHSLGAGALAERILARWGAAPRADEIRWHYHGDCPHNGEVEGAAPLDASDPVAQAKFSLHRLARTTEDAQYINRIVGGLAARLSEGVAPRAEGLDVERLAEALRTDPGIAEVFEDVDAAAADIAYRYADTFRRRPSDEEETQRVQERPVCKRFRHDEHCIDEPHG